MAFTSTIETTAAPLTAKIDRVFARAYTIPADRPKGDGRFEWDSNTIVVVHAQGGGKQGIGYSYTTPGMVSVIRSELSRAVTGRNAMDIAGCSKAMIGAVRTMGPGVAHTAAAALDIALWDLKARILGLPLVSLLGAARDRIPVYGSGGFTSSSDEELQRELMGWTAEGIRLVKIRIGLEPERDPARIRAARKAISPHVQLFVDADGAYSRKQALALSTLLIENDVTWYEQPVWHNDFDGLRLLRDRAPAPLEIASGEYGFETSYFLRLIQSGAVDVLQADVTRCGITGFLETAALCKAAYLPLSSRGAPAVSLHLCCAVDQARHLEYFHDHVRIENMLFEGVQRVKSGVLAPDLSRPGLGIDFKEKDAERFAHG